MCDLTYLFIFRLGMKQVQTWPDLTYQDKDGQTCTTHTKKFVTLSFRVNFQIAPQMVQNIYR